MAQELAQELAEMFAIFELRVRMVVISTCRAVRAATVVSTATRTELLSHFNLSTNIQRMIFHRLLLSIYLIAVKWSYKDKRFTSSLLMLQWWRKF